MGDQGFAGLVAVLTLGLAAGCDDSTGSDGGGDEGPAELRAAMEDAFASAPGFIDGFERLLAAVMGGPADGVAIVPAGNLVNLSVQVDTDGNESRETTVTGSAPPMTKPKKRPPGMGGRRSS